MLQKLRTELEGIHKMSEMYRKQVMSLEDDIAGYKEKEHLTTDAYQVHFILSSPTIYCSYYLWL